MPPPPPAHAVLTYRCPCCLRSSECAASVDGPSYPIVDPYGDHALNCASGNAQRTQHWHDPVRDDFVMFGKMVGLPTRREPNGMFPWSDERPDCVYTTNSGVEIVTDVRTCCPVAPPRGPSLTRRRPNPRIELVPEPEPEPDPEPQPEPTSLPTNYSQPESRPHGGATG